MPIFALNCRLKIEQVNAYCDDSGVDHLALSLRSLHFVSVSAQVLMRQHHFVRSCAAGSQESVGILKSFR